MAQIALRKTAEESEDTFPKTASVLKDNTYMDDICESLETATEAQQLTKEIDQVLAKGGFAVKGWISNCNLDEENLPQERHIGNYHNDKIKLQVKESKTTDSKSRKLTKRVVLSRIARVFDPVGLASAFLIKAKMGIQTLWKRGLEWDEELPSDLQQFWNNLFQEMSFLDSLYFERCLTPGSAIEEPILCTFSDASMEAFGACSYVRWKLQDGSFDVRLIAAKSRVAPFKPLTIPRLELQGAVLASRLYKSIVEETRFKFKREIFFLDSQIVLAWIRGEARRYKPFVSSRVSEIQSNSDPMTWRYIPGECNVADEVSHGIPAQSLTGRWQERPEFLRLQESLWPTVASAVDEAEVEREVRKGQVCVVKDPLTPAIECKRFSRWRRLVRVTAYESESSREVQNCRDFSKPKQFFDHR